jgi:dTDP-4-amino-4,6-dideoxygalactose transaminase
LPFIQPENRSAFHLYIIRVMTYKGAIPHQQIFEKLRDLGIGVNLHYMPVHLQPYYQELGFEGGQFPESETHGASAITLPLHPNLGKQDQDYIIQSVSSVVRN